MTELKKTSWKSRKKQSLIRRKGLRLKAFPCVACSYPQSAITARWVQLLLPRRGALYECFIHVNYSSIGATCFSADQSKTWQPGILNVSQQQKNPLSSHIQNGMPFSPSWLPLPPHPPMWPIINQSLIATCWSCLLEESTWRNRYEVLCNLWWAFHFTFIFTFCVRIPFHCLLSSIHRFMQDVVTATSQTACVKDTFTKTPSAW